MELRSRDLAILETVGELGTADTDIIHKMYYPGKTERACQQRLKKIADEGLLKRVRLIAVDDDMTSGSLPTLYFLTEEGAELVERETGRRPRRVTRSDPKPMTLRHRREIVRTRLAIDEAAKNAGVAVPEWIMEQDTRGGGKARKGHSPNEFQVLRNLYQCDNRTVSFRPDASCHLQLPHKATSASLIAYVEVDRSTEGHIQWEGKLQGIEPFINDPKAWRGHWPAIVDARIRILVLCKSQRRVSELIETTKRSRVASSILFTTFPLDAATVLAGDVWQACDGELKRIIKG